MTDSDRNIRLVMAERMRDAGSNHCDPVAFIRPGKWTFWRVALVVVVSLVCVVVGMCSSRGAP